jgi:hypothetical protein
MEWGIQKRVYTKVGLCVCGARNAIVRTHTRVDCLAQPFQPHRRVWDQGKALKQRLEVLLSSCLPMTR